MHNKNTSIVSPAYNERDNIRALLERGHRSMEPLGYTFEIIIVDDERPNEAWNVASQYADELTTCVENGADITIGSRFVERGALEEFSFLRQVTSKSADLSRELSSESYEMVRTSSPVSSPLGRTSLRTPTSVRLGTKYCWRSSCKATI